MSDVYYITKLVRAMPPYERNATVSLWTCGECSWQGKSSPTITDEGGTLDNACCPECGGKDVYEARFLLPHMNIGD